MYEPKIVIKKSSKICAGDILKPIKISAKTLRNFPVWMKAVKCPMTHQLSAV